MATPRRRSARLSKTHSTPDRSAQRKNASPQPRLGSLVEDDETSDPVAQSFPGAIVSTPNTPPNTSLQERLAQLSAIKTPTTLPRPARFEMNPKDIHRSTAKAPDAGLQLGFVDVSPASRKSAASAQNTPSKSHSRPSLPQHLTSPNFEFKFASDTHLSSEAQKLMENVREEAARIKAQMLAEKNEQDRKDGEAEELFGGVSTAGRKIAKPRGKAGRFSDVHMAQFKKMDSIANHASSFRAKPGFAQPTQQSLKRSGSKAGLDEPEKPRTLGRGTIPKTPSQKTQNPPTISPFKSITTDTSISDRPENTSPPKRMRQSELGDVSAGRPGQNDQADSQMPSAIPRSISGLPRGVLTPTKASLARSTAVKIPIASPEKTSRLPRSNSVKSLRNAFEAAKPLSELSTVTPGTSTSKLPRMEAAPSARPLPSLPVSSLSMNTSIPTVSLSRSPSTKSISSATPKKDGLVSRLPTFTGLRSILRPSRPKSSFLEGNPVEMTADTPKRDEAANTVSESMKKVDFTPSTKSRYAVKLAAGSPSPSKLPHAGSRFAPNSPAVPFDPAAYVLDEDDNGNDDDWEDAESEVEYPVLRSPSEEPSVPSESNLDNTTPQHVQDHGNREAKGFKSIFTTLEHPSRSNTTPTIPVASIKFNRTNTPGHAGKVTRSPSNGSTSRTSPCTIRRVRTSGVTEQVRPFEDTIKTVPHGLPGKKRRHESEFEDERHGLNEDAKENRRLSVAPKVPGGWNDEAATEEDEGEKRGGKRLRTTTFEEMHKEPDFKKPSAARETAARNAKDRKGKSILSLSRLHMLSKPKERK